MLALYRQTAQPQAEITAPLPPRADWIDQGFEQKLAGLSELLLLTLEEWQLIGRQLPTETEYLLRSIEHFVRRFGSTDPSELAADHDRLLEIFCNWARVAQAISDPNFATRPLRQLLNDCPESNDAWPSEQLTQEMIQLRKLPIANLVADQQEIRFYSALAQLGRLLSWLRLASPRPFFSAMQLASPKLVATAAAALTLESPSFALAAARLEAAWPCVGCWALAELLRTIYLSMLPPSANQSDLPLPAVKQQLAILGKGFGEATWAHFGEQALLRYGGMTWLLHLLSSDLPASPTAPRISCKDDRFTPPEEAALGNPTAVTLLRQLLLLLNGAQDGGALRAKENEIQQAIATLGVDRLSEAAAMEKRQRQANRRWCDLVPLDQD